MKIDINYVDDEDTLRRWNFDEPAIEFYDDHQHVAVPVSKVSGRQIEIMLKEWRTLPSIIFQNLVSIYTSAKRPDEA